MRHIAIWAILALFITGCASTQQTTRSGFLPDYQRLKPSDTYPDTALYVSEQLKNGALKQIRTIYLPHFEVWLQLNDEAKVSLSPADVAKLSIYMQAQLQQKLSVHYQVLLEQPQVLGPDVLTIRGAFTQIEFAPSEMEVRDFIPVRLVYSAGKSAYLMATEQSEVVTSVSLESMFYLGDSQEPVLMMSAHKAVESVVKQNGDENAQAVKAVLDVWIDNFVTAISKSKTI
ncbi:MULTISPECIES: DUF3313 family protein [Pseudoalteromonas]|uniref:DUF3313 family protein n=1 Tax=Pseudoalteromonas rubra TaxID=43658 RepID=A0A5S3V2P3_9GAMM|nr:MULTISPECIES: DUF3313 family protein [Pseudoalteromonas]MCG7562603.1 DUF3313 domain-containing protein [Pseudoalteromonas sp. McH1-42]MEC4089843.1 DUF3313 family protein [Pseudoalteromonas rubra]QPB84722.1 DUF3313 family protein [Pseudoalteromonas rubra]